MVRRLSVVFLLSFLLVTFLAVSVALGASKVTKPYKDWASFPARFAPVYSFGNTENEASFSYKGSESAATGFFSGNAVGTQVGITTYDYQHNCSMGHQIEHRGSNMIYFDWMYQAGTILGAGRSVGYQAYNLTTCDLQFSETKLASADYAGYVNLDMDPGGCAVIAGHEGADADNMAPRAYWDFSPCGYGIFSSDAPSDIFGWYQNHGVGPGNQNLWPIIEWQLGTSPVLHMVTAESGGDAGDPSTLSYYRRVGAYGAGNGVWSSQKIIDTAMNINPVLAASHTTDKVAMVWNRPCDYLGNDVNRWSQYANDIWYAVSNNQGASWLAGTGSIHHQVVTAATSGANITNYAPSSDYKAYCDIAALISSDQNLHIVWGGRRWTDTTTLYRRQSSIFHWSQDVPSIRRVVGAEWDTSGTCYAHAWGSDAAKMSISECDGKLYILYTQFGNAAAPCYDYSANKKVVNGELYLTASSNHGLNWDKPQNLTNSVTPLCADGSCESDYWATMARSGRTEVCAPNVGEKVLDIVYINDKSPGGCVQTESGIWTVNPVMWLKTPCRAVVQEPLYADNAGTGYGECYSETPLVVMPNGNTTIILTMENPGLLNNNYSITTAHGATWIGAIPSSGVISSGLNNTVDVTLTFTAPPSAPVPSLWIDTIVVTHDAVGSPRKIPVCMLVDSSFIYPQSATLATTCKQIRVYNTGELSKDASGASLDFIGDCDTLNPDVNPKIYLYDASPIICRTVGTDTLRFTMYSKTFTDPDGMRPIESLYVDETSYPDYKYARGKFLTADSAIGFVVEYFVPTAPDNCSFIVERLKFYNRTAATLTGVLAGEILDWDIPTDQDYDSTLGTGNGSAFDQSRKLIYQYGIEYNDSLEGTCGQNSDLRFGGIAGGPSTTFKNAFTIDNATYIYSTGPYGNAAPLPPGVIYKKMKENEGFSTYAPQVGHPESTYTDLSTIVTFGQYNIKTTDTICVVKILSTSKTGLGYLTTMVDRANTFIAAHSEMGCTCCKTAGDANHDGRINSGDAVFIISYIFRNGPPPPCIAEADANGDGRINSGDAVYIISYIFRGGPPPVCH